MKPYATSFYKSKQWKDCRKAYASSKRYLCERCLAKGIYKHGDIVHHKVYITPDNITNPMITLDWNNLELVCRDCHAEEHLGNTRRVTVDEAGRVLFNTPPV
jgi:5-methylcytosine-specific restriction endonuclease McrA